MAHINSDILRLGVDVGSTTVKAVALDPADNSVLFTRYQRHNAHQADTVRQLLEEAIARYSVEELTVNAQNPDAVGFYEHLGFRTYKRTELDEEGRPYPLLYMKLCCAN